MEERKTEFSWIEEKKNISVVNSIGDENGNEKIILRILEKEPDITARKINEKTGFSPRKISRIIKKLRESGEITRIGSDRKGYWQINRL